MTEDADLGFRLAATGGRIGMISPPTWEEATCGLWPWIRQRSRWLKGYAQTILVHTRPLPPGLPAQPRWRRAAKVASLWLTLGGPLVAAVLHGPALLWLVYACLRAWATDAAGPPPLALAMLGAGYASSALAGVAAAWLARDRSLLLAILLTPLYWPLQSVAAALAMRQLVVAPFRWEKTEHGVSRIAARPVPGTGDGAVASATLGDNGLIRTLRHELSSRYRLCRAPRRAPGRNASGGPEPAMHE